MFIGSGLIFKSMAGPELNKKVDHFSEILAINAYQN